LEAPPAESPPLDRTPDDLPVGADDSAGLGRPQQDPREAATPNQLFQPPGRRPLPQRDQAAAARPQVIPSVLPGFVGRREGGTMRVGRVAASARFSEFGAYQDRMWAAIVTQWHRLANPHDDRLPRPTEVSVRFRIDQEGRIVDLEVLSSTAGTIGTLIVRDAIQGRSPFGPFTEEMRSALNKQEEFRATFSYVYY
jgi:hypothetical protein